MRSSETTNFAFITLILSCLLTFLSLMPSPCASADSTFPIGHPDGAVSATFTTGFGSYAEEFNIYMWREDYEVWIEIGLIGDDNPFVCGLDFVIIQDSIQYDTVELLTSAGDSQCGRVYVNSIFKLTQWKYTDNPADLNHNFTLLFDGGEQTYTIDMVYDHRPPVAKAGPDQNVDGGTTVTLDGSTSFDPDGDTISYHWETDTYLDVTLSNANSMNPTFIAPEALYYFDQTITFKLTVGDGTFRTTDTVDIVIKEKEQPDFDDDDNGGGGCFISTIL